ncbi:hypothetical protein J4E81_001734 [Alternaria sp. BMP 2799]|nr:hypothetical protein J4E81_001734 [Alternaria sp. BMP 2799]
MVLAHQILRYSAATLRHKVFNDTLAKAYSILFPPITQERQPKKPVTRASPRSVVFSANTFDALSHLIEGESDFDTCASAFWQEVTSSTPELLIISDDSVSDSLALHTYVLELQNFVESIRGLWNSAATGEMSLAAAGWLTNIAKQYMQEWIYQQSPFSDCHMTLLNSYYSKAKPRGKREGLVSMWLEDPIGFKELGEQDDFLEFTHGYGLIWPNNDFIRFRPLIEAKDQSLTVKEYRRFEDYFMPRSEQRKLRQEFVDSISNYLPTHGVDDVETHEQKLIDISEKRHKEEQDLVKSMYRSLYQHPYWSIWEWCKWDRWDKHCLQSPFGIPLLNNLKRNPEGSPIPTTTIVNVWMNVESCCSFAPRHASEIPRRTNTRIRVLSFANEVKTAIEKLCKAPTDAAKFGTISQKWALYACHMIVQLQAFASEKTFDLYSQSPWVTGSYMSIIASRSMEMGLEILNEGGHVSNLLHLYNMLQQLKVPCPRIPILECLCDILSPAVFPYSEGRPTRQFDKMVRVTNGLPLFGSSTRTYRETKLNTTTKACEKDARIKIDSLSCFAYEAARRQYVPSTKFLAEITDKRYLTKKHDVRPNILARYTPSEILLRAKDQIAPEFEGSMPLPKVNFFAVMDLVLDVWKEVGCQIAKPDGLPGILKELRTRTMSSYADTRKHERSIGIQNGNVDSAANFLELVRYLVDEMLDEGAPRKEVRGWGALTILRDAVVKVCGDVKVEDLLWKNM